MPYPLVPFNWYLYAEFVHRYSRYDMSTPEFSSFRPLRRRAADRERVSLVTYIFLQHTNIKHKTCLITSLSLNTSLRYHINIQVFLYDNRRMCARVNNVDIDTVSAQIHPVCLLEVIFHLNALVSYQIK